MHLTKKKETLRTTKPTANSCHHHVPFCRDKWHRWSHLLKFVDDNSLLCKPLKTRVKEYRESKAKPQSIKLWRESPNIIFSTSFTLFRPFIVFYEILLTSSFLHPTMTMENKRSTNLKTCKHIRKNKTQI